MKIFPVLIGLLICIHTSAQKSMLRSELPEEYVLKSIPFNGQKVSSQYSGFAVAFHKSNGEMLLYGELPGDKVIYVEKITHKSSFYPAGFTGIRYANGEVRLCSTVPGKATEICIVFTFDDETLTYKAEEQSDPSQAQTTRANALLASGNVLEALAAYDSVQQAAAYYDVEKTGVQLLLAAGKSTEELATRRKFKEAIQMFHQVLNFKGLKFLAETKTEEALKAKLGKNLHGLTYNNLEKLMVVHTDHLSEARDYEMIISMCSGWVAWFPKEPRFLLALGDAYYGQKDKNRAREYYSAYIALMKELKRSKDIPPLVEQRANGK